MNMKKASPPKVKYNFSFMKVMTGHDLSVRRIPIMKIEHERSGPVVVLTAGMHGDEIGGTVVIQELFKQLKFELNSGTIYAFPMLNPFGFENTSRRISISNEDLNRSFPGNPTGSLAQRIAAMIMEKIRVLQPDLVLDLHNDWNKSIPYVVIDILEDKNKLALLHHYANRSGLPAIQEVDTIHTSFSYNLNIYGIPALTLELGESLIINEKNIIYGTNAVLNLLSELEMTKQSNELGFKIPEIIQNKVLSYSSNPLCSASGIIRFAKKPGDLVKEGEKIARVYNAFGKHTETIRSVHNGIILGHNDYAVSYPGSPVMAFGVLP